jgi:hypothetical protein
MKGSVVPDADIRTYYDRPVIKPPVWHWYIPAYFFTGGLAAGSSLLAAGATARGARAVALRARWTALAAVAVSGAFLVLDLGRPGRFHHMLRVAKPSSPMSMGTWLLTAYGPAAGLAATAPLVGLDGVGTAAGVAAAALSPALATYTAVLTSDTAVPAWHDVRRRLPFLFAASATASAGGVALMLGPDPTGAAARMAVGGAMAELAASRAVAAAGGDVYHRGRAGRLARASELAAVAGSALILARRRRLGGALLAAGAIATRFSITAAGTASALDPRATTAPQKARLTQRSPG